MRGHGRVGLQPRHPGPIASRHTDALSLATLRASAAVVDIPRSGPVGCSQVDAAVRTVNRGRHAIPHRVVGLENGPRFTPTLRTFPFLSNDVSRRAIVFVGLSNP